MTLEQVVRTTGNALYTSPLTFLEASTPGVGGFFDTPSQRLGVRHELPISTPADLARVPVDDQITGGEPRRIGDVADVVEDHPLLIGDAILTDDPGLFIVVEKLPEANALDVARDLEKALADMKPGLGGVTVDTSVFDPATYLAQSDDNLRTVLIISLVLLVFGLAVLLLDWRATIVAVLQVAVALAAAVGVLVVREVTINAMTLAGLLMAVLVLVDDAVVNVDAARARLAGGLTTAIAQVRGPLGYATAIVTAVTRADRTAHRRERRLFPAGRARRMPAPCWRRSSCRSPSARRWRRRSAPRGRPNHTSGRWFAGSATGTGARSTGRSARRDPSQPSEPCC